MTPARYPMHASPLYTGRNNPGKKSSNSNKAGSRIIPAKADAMELAYKVYTQASTSSSIWLCPLPRPQPLGKHAPAPPKAFRDPKNGIDRGTPVTVYSESKEYRFSE
jgi:hypothetical protein